MIRKNHQTKILLSRRSKGHKEMNQIDWALLILALGSGLATGLIIFFGERQQRKMQRHSSHPRHGQ
ncbi:exported hypothetical protein [Acidithiobacillus ferrivorans]|uniref:Uncharacterized protein n=2 Tax=Acidithiobacillus ferrivorans TaxID=160808 RepID=A0A060UQY9_9PROT|nr:exported hypothetical protein [Acidithiobacillus ferrivorans]